MMNNELIIELIERARIVTDGAAVATLLAKLAPVVDGGLMLDLELAINKELADMQLKSFVAGMRAGATGQTLYNAN
jgi:hypothetical protein